MSTELIDDALVDDELTIERYELREEPKYRFDATRRQFVQVLGAGLVIAVSADKVLAQRRGRRGGRRGGRSVNLTQRMHVGADGTVTLFTSKVEVGQGSRTQITQAAAEELRLPVEKIQLVMADTARCPDDGGTAGSRTTPSTVPTIRAAAATARRVLTELAAERLEVESSNVQLAGGVFTAGDQRLTLAELASGEGLAEAMNVTPAADVSVTRVDSWRVLGTSVPKVGGRDVVTGRAVYPSDVQRENMLYGKVLRPVSYDATLKSIDLSPAEQMEGVTVVRDGNFVGCAAPTSWLATQAVDSLYAAAEWEESPQPASDQLYAHLKEHARSGGGGGFRGGRENSWGDGVAKLEATDDKFTATYNIAYIQHAPMEPRAAVAEWNDGKLTVWTGTQQPSRVQGELAQTFRLEPANVRVIARDGGGGFGGKHSGEAAVEAARLAMAAGRPVSLRWTREEEFTWAYFRPAGVIDIQAALDDGGRLLAWDMTNINSGGSALESPYTVPHGRTRFQNTDSPLRQGSYRALASTANTFARESAMDELAKLAGVDPLEFRLNHLSEGRLKNALVAAAERFGWRRRRAAGGENRGVGLACGTEKGSFTAACAEVEIADGKIKVLQVCQAFECGAIQNPKNVRAQVEGCIMMGLGGALFERMEFRDGKILNPYFSEYRVPRMSDLPELEIVLLNRRDLPSIGAGETPIIAVAPAVANAVFQAVGIRSRSLPLSLQA